MSADQPSSPLATYPDSAIETFRLRFRAALQKIGAARSSIWPEYWPQGPLIRILIGAPAGASLPGRLDPIGVVRFAETGEFTSPLDWSASAERIGLNQHDAALLRSASDLDKQSAWRDMLIEEMQGRPSDGWEATQGSSQSDERAFAVLKGLVVLVLSAALIQWFRAEPFPLPSYDVFKSAIVPCRSYVMARLSTPATASFPARIPGLPSQDGEVQSIAIPGGYRYVVTSYVDAQNEQGAVVRTRFGCSVDRVARGGDFGGLFVSHRPWPLIDLRMAPWLAATRNDSAAQTSWVMAAGDPGTPSRR